MKLTLIFIDEDREHENPERTHSAYHRRETWPSRHKPGG